MQWTIWPAFFTVFVISTESYVRKFKLFLSVSVRILQFVSDFREQKESDDDRKWQHRSPGGTVDKHE